MYYLFIEIFSFRQLQKINLAFINKINQELFNHLRDRRKRLLKQENGNFLFYFREREQNHQKLIEIIFEAKIILDRYKRDLHGFSLYVDVLDQTDPEIVWLKMRQKMMTVVEDNHLLFSPKVYEIFSSFIQAEKLDDLYAVTNLNEQSSEVPEIILNLIRRPDIQDQIFSLFDPFLIGENEHQAILIAGEGNICKRNALEMVLRQLNSRQDGEWLYIAPLYRRNSIIHPFLNSITPTLIEKIPEYLSKTEKKVWGDLCSILSFYCPDYTENDFFMFYDLILTGYTRFMAANLLPPLVIIEEVENYNTQSLDALRNLLMDRVEIGTVIPIFLSNTGNVPEQCRDLDFSRLEIQPVQARDIRCVIDAIEPHRTNTEKENEVKRIMEVTKGKSLPIFHYLILSENKKTTLTNLDNPYLISEKVLEEMDTISQTVLYIILLAKGMVYQQELSQFLVQEGIEKRAIDITIQRLYELGLITLSLRPIGTLPELLGPLTDIMAGEAKALATSFAKFIFTLWQKGEYHSEVLLYSFLEEYGTPEQAVNVFSHLIKARLDEGKLQATYIYRKKIPEILKLFEQSEKKQTAWTTLLSLELRLAIVGRDQETAHTVYTQLEKITQGDELEKDGDTFLQQARFFIVQGEYRQAIDHAKKGLLYYQDTEDAFGIAEANLMMALIMITTQRPQDAMDYIFIAKENKVPPQSWLRIVILYFEVTVHFLHGNYSRVLEICGEGIECANLIQRRELLCFFIFMNGRASFEIGEYHKSAEYFQKALQTSRLYPDKKRTALFYAWLARSLTYSDNARRGHEILIDLPQSPEVDFFLAENYYFRGEYRAMFNRCNLALDTLTAKSLDAAPEIIEWYDGYYLVEDRCFKNPQEYGVLYSFIRSLRALALRQLGRISEAVEECNQITRYERLSVQDPYNRIYEFIYAMVLSSKQYTDSIDEITVLSKALNSLQMLSSKIDDVEKKQSFLKNNYWNNLLIQKAREQKLM